MDEPCIGTALTVSVCVNATVSGRFASVNELEQAVVAAAHKAGRELYQSSFRTYQTAWLEQRCGRFIAQRWRTIHWLTPFGPVEVPVRVVRDKSSGRYFSLSKVLFGFKATRLLCPALEQEACAAATQQNFRPAAASISRWIKCQVGHWLIWACVQFHGARLLEKRDKEHPPRTLPLQVPALISEMDSTWLKAQKRRRLGPVRHFPVHLGLHYTGRKRRYHSRGSRSLQLQNKHLLITAEPMALFGRQFQLQAHQRFLPKYHVLLSDGDEGLERLREKHFPSTPWLLDRWHILQKIRALTGPDHTEFSRLMTPIWNADSQAALAALSTSPYRQGRPKEFNTLFAYILGNTDGIDSWNSIPK
jgi:hypothetical protein